MTTLLYPKEPISSIHKPVQQNEPKNEKPEHQCADSGRKGKGDSDGAADDGENGGDGDGDDTVVQSGQRGDTEGNKKGGCDEQNGRNGTVGHFGKRVQGEENEERDE